MTTSCKFLHCSQLKELGWSLYVVIVDWELWRKDCENIKSWQLVWVLLMKYHYLSIFNEILSIQNYNWGHLSEVWSLWKMKTCKMVSSIESKTKQHWILPWNMIEMQKCVSMPFETKVPLFILVSQHGILHKCNILLTTLNSCMQPYRINKPIHLWIVIWILSLSCQVILGNGFTNLISKHGAGRAKDCSWRVKSLKWERKLSFAWAWTALLTT